jgi:hypothetical protein
MTIPLTLGLAYAAIAALLLNLNLSSELPKRYRRAIKISAIIVVSILYAGTYHGSQNLRGWAIAKTPPNPFKLHWAIVEEPDKIKRTDGAIYILGQALNRNGVPKGSPRLYELPFTPELAEEIDEALNKKEDGKPLEARMSYKAANPDSEMEEIQKRDGNKSRPDSAGDEERLKLEFRELPTPNLPPK